jgi:hypothetical protein
MENETSEHVATRCSTKKKTGIENFLNINFVLSICYVIVRLTIKLCAFKFRYKALVCYCTITEYQ